MIKEALDLLFTKANEQADARSAKKLDFLSDPLVTRFEFGRQIVEHNVAPPLRWHFVDSVLDLCVAANKWATNGTVWLGEDEVVLIVDDADRRERVTLPLVKSHVFQAVEELENTPFRDQPSLIRLLRREFRKSPQATTLLASIRQIKFRRGESGHSDLQHGNESMGRTIEEEVTGAADILDELMLPLSVYANPGERETVVSVAFTLDIDVQGKRFAVKPQPDEVSMAVGLALASIRKAIVAGGPKDIPVMYGRP